MKDVNWYAIGWFGCGFVYGNVLYDDTPAWLVFAINAVIALGTMLIKPKVKA